MQQDTIVNSAMAEGSLAAGRLLAYMRHCLRSDAADVLLASVETYARKLSDGNQGDGSLPAGWLDGVEAGADDGDDRAPGAALRRVARRRAVLAALDDAIAAVSTTAVEDDAEAEPEALSADFAAEEFALDPLDTAILLLGLRCAADRAIDGLADAVLWRLRDPAETVATLLGCDRKAVRARIAAGAPLAATGLIAPAASRTSLFGDYDGALILHSSLRQATVYVSGGREAWVAGLLGLPCGPGLPWDDFAHLGEVVDLAARLLGAAARSGAPGVHILLYGPPGTGKSELARALAARAGLRLFAVGETSEEGEEPSRAERGGALRLALGLTRHRRDAALLFDEAEDALEAAPRQSAARDDQSKAWLNRLLEANPTPVLWTCNGLDRMDRATLRRMSLLIEVGIPRETAIRARVWGRVLTRERLALAEGSSGRLAERWAAAPAVCATAARAARLAGGGEPEVETALKGFAQVLGGGAPAVTGQGEAARFDPDLIACDHDMEAMLDCLTRPGVSAAWTMLVCGPPGSGKSTLARHLADRLGPEVVRRRSVDLTGNGMGGPARALAAAFAEARARHAVLVLDGIAQVAVDRDAPDAEGTALETLLACLDDHPLPVLCTADLPHRLDRAVLRRFLLTLRLSGLDPERAAWAFREILGAEPPGLLPNGITIGDLVAVQRRRDLLGGGTDAYTLFTWLSERAQAGGTAAKVIGFRPHPDRAEHGWLAAKPA